MGLFHISLKTHLSLEKVVSKRGKRLWEKTQGKLSRIVESRGLPHQSFLIVCEGEKTEPNYFKAFRVKSAQVVVEGTGCNTISLVDKTRSEERRVGKECRSRWSPYH